jgi:hypothetical protein
MHSVLLSAILQHIFWQTKIFLTSACKKCLIICRWFYYQFCLSLRLIASMVLMLAGNMVRSYKPVRGSAHVPVEDSSVLREVVDVEPTPIRKRRKKNDGTSEPQEIQFKVYCPCKLCELRPKPTTRLLSIVRSHIRSHEIGTKYKVTNHYSSIPYYIVIIFY